MHNIKLSILALLATVPMSIAAQNADKAKPVAIETTSLTYDYATSTATLKWNPVVEDQNGNALTTTDVTYTVRRRGDSNPIATGLTDCTFTDAVTFDDINASVSFGQKRLQYYVTAHNAQGDSPSTLSQIRAVGQAENLPFVESFAGGENRHFWTESHIGSGRWTPMTTSNKYTQDADGGLYTFSAQNDGESSTGYSALINLDNAQNPVLTFYVFYVFPSGDVNLLVSTDGGEYQTAWTFDMENDAPNEWIKVEVPLADFGKAHHLQFAFEATNFSVASCLYIDNINLQDLIDHDLDISLVSLPRNLIVGEKHSATVKVTNRGAQPVSGHDYTVSILADSSPLATAQGLDIESGTSITIPVKGLVANAFFGTSTTLNACLEYAADEYEGNNTTPSTTVAVVHSLLPAPRNAEATNTDTGILLTWAAPDAPRSESTPITDSFEDYEDFAIDGAGDWTFHQGVYGNVYTLEETTFPNAGHPQAWMVFNPTEAGIGNRPAHTGDKYLVAFSHPYVKEDSWLISTFLGGNAQQISFWARAFDTYKETFKVSYSTDDMDTESFADLRNSTTTLTKDWTEYTFDLPEGTKYFAIRATSNDALGLMLDDITYVPATLAAQHVTLAGYNIYRDGQLVATLPADAQTFTDTPEDGAHTYRLAALWDKGESALTPTLSVERVTPEAISAISAETHTAASYDLSGRKTTRARVIISGSKKIWDNK